MGNSIVIITNCLRRETGRHLNTEELNGICGTINMTRHNILRTHLSNVVEMLDKRGQIIKLAASFKSEKFSPSSSKSHSPHAEGLQLNSSNTSGHTEAENSKISSSYSADMVMTPGSGQTSFYSAEQFLETSGEGGYATGYDASPESDVSLDYSVERSALESTPRRTHEITLCNVDELEPYNEDEGISHTMENNPSLKDQYLSTEQGFDDHSHKYKFPAKLHTVDDHENKDITSSSTVNSRKDFDMLTPLNLFRGTISERNTEALVPPNLESGDYSEPDSASYRFRESDEDNMISDSEEISEADDVFENDNCNTAGISGEKYVTSNTTKTSEELVILSESVNDDVDGEIPSSLREKEELVIMNDELKLKQKHEVGKNIGVACYSKDGNHPAKRSEISSSDGELEFCIEMEPIPDDVCVVHRIYKSNSYRHGSLPASPECAKTMLKNLRIGAGAVCQVATSCPETLRSVSEVSGRVSISASVEVLAHPFECESSECTDTATEKTQVDINSSVKRKSKFWVSDTWEKDFVVFNGSTDCRNKGSMSVNAEVHTEQNFKCELEKLREKKEVSSYVSFERDFKEVSSIIRKAYKEFSLVMECSSGFSWWD
ncbi:hypothetical protein DICVIV_12456 [Dictyocaulus viviparus]|uniref:Uncharacterized protein n=1 Tax=Dictyocaulus viviparus TaxID=29172 RepID=A0A0D8XAE0_DICVI|nr:hypothetical protein DICVIV_12456 [Dictyocaulus viviparus]